MNTLAHQKKRLEAEIFEAKNCIAQLKECMMPDMKTIKLHNETIERNMQLIAMIDNHLRLDHQPMWREI